MTDPVVLRLSPYSAKQVMYAIRFAATMAQIRPGAIPQRDMDEALRAADDIERALTTKRVDLKMIEVLEPDR